MSSKSTGFTCLFASEMLLEKLSIPFKCAYQGGKGSYLRAYIVSLTNWDKLEDYYKDDVAYDPIEDQMPVLARTDDLMLSLGEWGWRVR